MSGMIVNAPSVFRFHGGGLSDGTWKALRWLARDVRGAETQDAGESWRNISSA